MKPVPMDEVAVEDSPIEDMSIEDELIEDEPIGQERPDLDDVDRRLLDLVQKEFPLTERPFQIGRAHV